MTARLYQLTRRRLHDELTLHVPRTEREAKADPLDWADPAVVNAVLDTPATSEPPDTATVRAVEAFFFVALIAIAAAFALLSWIDHLPPNGVTK